MDLRPKSKGQNQATWWWTKLVRYRQENQDIRVILIANSRLPWAQEVPSQKFVCTHTPLFCRLFYSQALIQKYNVTS